MTLKEYIERGNHALKVSNWEMALQYWSTVYAQVPNHQWAGVTVGLTLFRLNRFDEATPYLLDDIETHPDRELAFVYLAKISQAQENWGLNVQQWGIIVSRFPDYEWALQSYANALKQLDELNKAERYFHMDVMKYQSHVWSYAQLIEIVIEKQQLKLAEQRLKAFSEWYPDEIEIYNKLHQTIQDKRDMSFYNRVYKPSYFRVHFTSAKQQKFMYALIPKIASTTTLVRLYTQLIGEQPPDRIPHDEMIKAFRDKAKHHHKIFDYYTFTIVRNPYTRILSAYLHTMRRPKSIEKFRAILGFGPSDGEEVAFMDFLRRIREIPLDELNGHFCPQWYLLSLHQFAKYDFIGRFENLESDLHAVIRHIVDDEYDGANAITRRPHATYAGEKLQQYYGKEEQALVAEIYEDDFKYLGYGYDLDLA